MGMFKAGMGPRGANEFALKTAADEIANNEEAKARAEEAVRKAKWHEQALRAEQALRRVTFEAVGVLAVLEAASETIDECIEDPLVSKTLLSKAAMASKALAWLAVEMSPDGGAMGAAALLAVRGLAAKRAGRQIQPSFDMVASTATEAAIAVLSGDTAVELAMACRLDGFASNGAPPSDKFDDQEAAEEALATAMSAIRDEASLVRFR